DPPRRPRRGRRGRQRVRDRRRRRRVPRPRLRHRGRHARRAADARHVGGAGAGGRHSGAARACVEGAAVCMSEERRIDRMLLLLAPAVLFLLALFIYPFLYGLVRSLQPERYVGTLGNYQQFFADPFLRDTIPNTLRLAIPAAVLNVAVSVPVAYRLRGRFR